MDGVDIAHEKWSWIRTRMTGKGKFAGELVRELSLLWCELPNRPCKDYDGFEGRDSVNCAMKVGICGVGLVDGRD